MIGLLVKRRQQHSKIKKLERQQSSDTRMFRDIKSQYKTNGNMKLDLGVFAREICKKGETWKPMQFLHSCCLTPFMTWGMQIALNFLFAHWGMC